MNKKVLTLSLAGAIAFSGVGVYATKPIKATSPTKIQLSQVEKVTVEKKLLKTDENIKITVPVFKGLKDVNFQNKLNKKIEDQALRDMAEFKLGEKEAKSIDSAAEDSELIIDFSLKSMGKTLSLVSEKYSIIYGQANGEIRRDYYNIDLEENKELSLEDLFKKDSQYKEIINGEIKTLINKNSDSYFPMEKTEESPEIMGFTGINKDTSFYINNVGDLVICFDLYEIAPRSTGYPEFVIPAYKLKEALIKDQLVRTVFTSKQMIVESKEDVSLMIPEIKGLENKELENKLNQDIKSYVEKAYKSFEKEVKEIPAPKDSDMKSEFKVGYRVFSENDKSLSFKLDSYKYLRAAANGENTEKYYNIDLEEGKLMELKDLFKANSNYKEPINKFIKSEIEKNKEAYYDGEEAFKTIKDSQNFYLDPDNNLVVVFEQYEIAPRYMGMPEFKIPANLIKDILK